MIVVRTGASVEPRLRVDAIGLFSSVTASAMTMAIVGRRVDEEDAPFMTATVLAEGAFVEVLLTPSDNTPVPFGAS